MVKQSHQPCKKDAHVRLVWQQPSRLGIATRLGYLSEPDGRIDGEGLVGQRLDGQPVPDGEEEPPEVAYSHVDEGEQK